MKKLSIFPVLLVLVLLTNCNKDNSLGKVTEDSVDKELLADSNVEEYFQIIKEEISDKEVHQNYNINSRNAITEWEVRPKYGKPSSTKLK